MQFTPTHGVIMFKKANKLFKKLVGLFSWATSGQQETYYSVSRDGRLVLCRHELLKSGRMERQFQAARELKKMAAQTSKKE